MCYLRSWGWCFIDKLIFAAMCVSKKVLKVESNFKINQAALMNCHVCGKFISKNRYAHTTDVHRNTHSMPSWVISEREKSGEWDGW